MRRTRNNRAIAGAVLGVLPLFLVAGCSFSIGIPAAVDAETVAEQTSEMLAQEVGQAPDDVTCADDLPAEVGAEIRCEVSQGGVTLGATLTVTEVEGSSVKWDIKVDEAATDEGAAGDDTGAADTGAADTGTGDAPLPGNDNSAVAVNGIVSADQVAQKSSDALAALVGQVPDDLTCTEGLPARVDASIRCTLTDGGTSYGVTATVTSVQGDQVGWDVLVDDQPL